MSFVLSCFADEIDSDLSVQIREMKRNGIGHLELRGVDGKNVADLTGPELREIKKRLDIADIRVSAIGSPIGKIGINDDFTPHMAAFERMLEAAKIMGARYIRIFSFYMPKGEDPQKYLEPVCERLEQFKRKAKPLNLVLLHENEKGIFG
ncbi:MAG TPA: TIM barrel protein, partial [Clostridiales bacterium]|nr:TIM barrel protein [Clostridiales bacterium]